MVHFWPENRRCKTKKLRGRHVVWRGFVRFGANGTKFPMNRPYLTNPLSVSSEGLGSSCQDFCPKWTLTTGEDPLQASKMTASRDGFEHLDTAQSQIQKLGSPSVIFRHFWKMFGRTTEFWTCASMAVGPGSKSAFLFLVGSKVKMMYPLSIFDPCFSKVHFLNRTAHFLQGTGVNKGLSLDFPFLLF